MDKTIKIRHQLSSSLELPFCGKNTYKRCFTEAKNNPVCNSSLLTVINKNEADFKPSCVTICYISSLIRGRRGLWCGMCPSQITPVQSVLWSQNQEGMCVCVCDWYDLGFYGVWGWHPPPPPSPTIASDPGGQLSCDVGPLPASFPQSPHLVPWAQSRCRVGAAAAPAPQPRLKAPGLILNLLALAFS